MYVRIHKLTVLNSERHGALLWLQHTQTGSDGFLQPGYWCKKNTCRGNDQKSPRSEGLDEFWSLHYKHRECSGHSRRNVHITCSWITNNLRYVIFKKMGLRLTCSRSILHDNMQLFHNIPGKCNGFLVDSAIVKLIGGEQCYHAEMGEKLWWG